jgi:AAA+ ATPase superfamily predicted ATPase
VLKEIETNFNDNFVSFAYEDFVQEQILRNPLKYLGFVPLKIGRWWNNKEEIDLVAFDEEKIVFIECKWRNKKVNKSVFEALKVKSELIDVSLKKSYVMFSKVGCSEALEREDVGCFVF